MKVWLLLDTDGDVLFFQKRPSTRKGYLITCSEGFLPLQQLEALVGKLELKAWDQADYRLAYENCDLPRYADIEEAVEFEFERRGDS